ncbi:MAG: hydrogenase nickel incorporation protein HypB [Phycisphaerae bacterium]|nr:hydrogenase nickel incorporation protein HypB [Phycisphaerae bacterium]
MSQQRQIQLKKNVYNRNQELADELRERFKKAGTYVINMISSPGSGKTSLIEKMAPRLNAGLKLFVIDGDLETERDADRLREVGIEAVQIQTHGSCHLDATMIGKALEGVALEAIDLLIIENVGNLVCPTSFDLGETLRVVVASTTEGDDKPLKYPASYHRAGVCIFNKTDLLPYVRFDVAQFEAAARRANGELKIFHTSCSTGQGIEELCQWLSDQVGGMA